MQETEVMGEYQNLIGDMMEAFKSQDPKLVIMCFAGIITYVILLVLTIKGKVFNGYDRRINKAKAAGHVIVGKKVEDRSRLHRDNDGHRERRYVATYELEVNGKTKKKRFSTKNQLPLHMEFYYVNNPNKLFTTLNTGRMASQLFLYIIPIAVMMLVGKLLGYEG